MEQIGNLPESRLRLRPAARSDETARSAAADEARAESPAAAPLVPLVLCVKSGFPARHRPRPEGAGNSRRNPVTFAPFAASGPPRMAFWCDPGVTFHASHSRRLTRPERRFGVTLV
jgi:hypothetical protein